MNKKKAIERIENQIEKIDHLKTMERFSPDFEKWKRSTEIVIEKVFGSETRHKTDFNKIHFSLSICTLDTPESTHQGAYIGGLEHAQSILESFVEEITEYWPDDPGVKIKEAKQGEKKTTVDSIWEEIKNDLDEDKYAFGRKINFISDRFRKKIIFRDVAHAYYLAKNSFPKPAVILAGGVIEELLRLFLDHKGEIVKNKSYDDLIKMCINKGFLKAGINKMNDSVRYFRNLVHMEREKDKRHTISKPTALGAVTSIFTLANDF